MRSQIYCYQGIMLHASPNAVCGNLVLVRSTALRVLDTVGSLKYLHCAKIQLCREPWGQIQWKNLLA